MISFIIINLLAHSPNQNVRSLVNAIDQSEYLQDQLLSYDFGPIVNSKCETKLLGFACGDGERDRWLPFSSPRLANRAIVYNEFENTLEMTTVIRERLRDVAGLVFWLTIFLVEVFLILAGMGFFGGWMMTNTT